MCKKQNKNILISVLNSALSNGNKTTKIVRSKEYIKLLEEQK